MACRDPKTYEPCKPHKERISAALAWYDRASPDGLTPRRRDAMVEQLRQKYPGKGHVGQLMQRITTSPDPEREYAALVS